MQKFINFMDKYIVSIGNKVIYQRHIVSIRNGFAIVMPIMIIGAFALVVRNFPVKAIISLYEEGFSLYYLKVASLNIYGGTMFLIGLFLTLAIGYELGKSYDVDGFSTAIVTLAATFILFGIFEFKPPVTWEGLELGALVWEPGIPTIWLGEKGLIVSIPIALIFGTVFCKLQKVKALVINLPEAMPLAVSRGFKALLPSVITLIIVGIVYSILESFGIKYLYSAVNLGIENLFVNLFANSKDTLWTLLILIFIQQLLCFFGVSGKSLLTPATISSFALISGESMSPLPEKIFENSEVLNSIFIDSYINIGGIGITISLMLAIIFASRSKFNKAVTKATILPALFNVNEPFLFGLPLILNPIYIIPFIIAPMASATLAYLMSTSGFLGSSAVIVRWSIPPIIQQWLVAEQWQGAVTAVACIGIAFLVYLPFVIYENSRISRLIDKN